MVIDEQDEIDRLKTVTSIIEYRCHNILKTRKLIELDIQNLYLSKGLKIRDKICLGIYDKLEYIEILLSKNVDDIMSAEIIEMDKHEESDASKQDGFGYYQ